MRHFREKCGRALRDRAPRLPPEASLDQGGFHPRSDHRLAVQLLDLELPDQALPEPRPRGSPVRRPTPASSSSASENAFRLSPRRAGARRRGASRRRPRCGPGGAGHSTSAGERGAIGGRRVGGCEHQEDPRRAAGCGGARLRRGARTGRRPAPRRNSRASLGRASRVLELAVDRCESAGDSLGDRGLAGEDPVALQHQLREGPHPRAGGRSVGEQGRRQRPAAEDVPEAAARRRAKRRPARSSAGRRERGARSGASIVGDLAGPGGVPDAS